MAYTKNEWTNSRSVISAAKLNKIEEGLFQAAKTADTALTDAAGAAGQAAAALEAVDTLRTDHNTDIDALVTYTDAAVNEHATAVNGDLSAVRSAISGVSADLASLATKQDTDNTAVVNTVNHLDGTLTSLAGDFGDTRRAFNAHESNKTNPHAVTADQVGAYTKAEVDSKLLLEQKYTGSVGVTSSSVSFALENFPAFTKNISLNVTSNREDGQLWKMSKGSVLFSNISVGGQMTLTQLDVNTRYASSASPATAFLGKKYEYTSDFLATNARYSVLAGVSVSNGLSNGYITSETNVHNTQDLFLYFLSASKPDTAYVIGIGSLYNCDSASDYIAFCVNSDGLFVETNTADTRLSGRTWYKGLPTDLRCVAIGYVGGGSAYAAYTIYSSSIGAPVVWAYDTSINTVIPLSSIYSAGSQLFPCEQITYDGVVWCAISSLYYEVFNYELSYLLDQSKLDLFKYLPQQPDVATELQKLISTGTADPDSSTQGLFYFKYI